MASRISSIAFVAETCDMQAVPGSDPPVSCAIDEVLRHDLKPIPSRHSLFPKQIQINRIGHGPVAGIVRMNVISRIVVRAEPGRMLRIPDHGVKVDYAIERMTGADPFVYRHPGCFHLNGKFGLAFTRKECSSKDLEMIAVRPGDELLETTDYLLRGDRLLGQIVAYGMSDIINTFENNQKLNSGHTQHISIKAG